MYIQELAPAFKADALMPDGSFKQISISDFYKKKYVLLFFYPLDFTFVCPSEIIAFSKKMSEFRKRNTQILGISVDSKFTHHAWTNTMIKNGGVGAIEFPLISDLSKSISKQYDVLLNNSVAVRATFLIDKEGIVKHYSLNDLSLGRNTDDYIRLLDALQHTEEHGEVCPSDWKKGSKGMIATSDGAKKYLQENFSDI